MQRSANFIHWKQHRQTSYVPATAHKRLLDFCMGETTRMHGSVPYPEPSQAALKKRISNMSGLTQDRVTIGNGCDELIERIPQVFLSSGDTALIVTPTFFRFFDATHRVGATSVIVPTDKKEMFRLTPNVEKKIIRTASIKSCKVIWLCSPNNPTGVTIAAPSVARIAQNTSALVVIDESFIGVSQFQNDFLSLIGAHNNILLLRSFSKLSGLAGLRIGFALGDPQLIEPLEAWRLPFNVSKLSIDRIIQQLPVVHREEIRTRKDIAAERDRLFTAIKKLPHLEIGALSESHIFILRHKTNDLFALLMDEGIRTAELRNTAGLEQMNFVRITIQTKRKNDLLLNALIKINSSML